MTTLCVSSRFAVRGIWVRPEALGESFTWDVDGSRVTLTLPRNPEDFINTDETEIPVVPAWVPTARIEGSGEAVSAQVFAVAVEFSGTLSASDKERAAVVRPEADDGYAREFGRAAQLLWSEGHDVALRMAHGWLAHVRVVSGQPWLGIAVEPPAQYGRSHIYDHEAGVRLMSYGPEKKATIRSGQLALSLDQLMQIHDHVAVEREPSTAESLLADGRFLAQEAEVADLQRAVLVAAAACEIKSKQTMRQRIEPSKSDLLDLVLRRVSNLPQLLDSPLRAALGISLREADRDLYDRVSRLADVRNEVIHRGANVDEAEGWRLIVAAGQLFVWLDGLQPAHR
jgi:hypothetical protein